jgi:hypothetical protein
MTGGNEERAERPHGGGMTYRRASTAVLAQWRTVEHEMLIAPPDSPEFDRLNEAWARLRLEYGRLTDLAARDVSTADGDPKRKLADRSGDMLGELAHLKETEELKRREPISTGPFHELADEVSASSRRVYKLGAELEKLGDESATGEVTIEDVTRAG